MEVELKTYRDKLEHQVREQTIGLIRANENLKKEVVKRTIAEEEVRAREEVIRESEERFRTLFNKANDFIFLVRLTNDGSAGSFIEVNEVACRKLGYTREELLSMRTADIVTDECIADIPKTWKKCLDKGFATFERTYITKDGHRILVEINSHVFKFKGVTVAFSIGRDVSERKKAEAELKKTNKKLEEIIRELHEAQNQLRENNEKLRYLGLHDVLTGVYNRNCFEEEMRCIQNGGGYPVSIMVCDLDGLKYANDSFGHDDGDQLLIAAADVLKKSFRESDVIARIGGDEFAVILPNTDADVAQELFGRIRYAIDKYNMAPSQFPLSISIGVSTSLKEKENLNEVFKRADHNMYREKLHREKSGRSAIVQAFNQALAARDCITEEHADRLKDLVVKFAKAVRLNEQTISELKLLASFHDIGKLGIPDDILLKPGPLTEEEYKQMKKHPEIGYRIAQTTPDLFPIADWILKHHEWWNGKGYPLGLKGEEIPLESRILSIVDAFDAMTNDRPYRKAIPQQKAIEELEKNAGVQFDPQLVPVFINVLKEESSSLLYTKKRVLY